MAEGKKGFILYADQKELFDQLPDDKAGILIKHIFKYVNDDDPKSDDIIINLAFTPIKQQLKRDLKHWEDIRKKRSDAGKASAEARKVIKHNSTNSTSVKSVQHNSTNSTSVKSVQHNSTKATVIDNVNVKVNDIDKERALTVLNAFKENVLIEAKELNFDKSIYIPFLEHWTERDFESKCYAWQVPETFIIKSRLKGWKRNDKNKQVKENTKLWTS